jgi:multidrug transporter EmrE-like cation transporter
VSRISPVGFLLIFLTIAATVVGQLLVKRGMLQVGASPSHLALLPRFLLRAFTNISVIVGILCAILAAASWTVAISRLDLSVAYPFLGLGLVLVLALSSVFFGETVPLSRWVGVLVVCIGLVIASRN